MCFYIHRFSSKILAVNTHIRQPNKNIKKPKHVNDLAIQLHDYTLSGAMNSGGDGDNET